MHYNTEVMNAIVEIRAAEGGEDAKSLVVEQIRIYSRLCQKHDL